MSLDTLPRTTPLDRSSTNIRKAVAAAARLKENKGNTVILLITDGLETHDSLEKFFQIRNLGIRCYLINIRNDTGPSVAIEDMHIADRITLGQKALLRVAIKSEVDTEVEAVITVDHKPINYLPIKLAKNKYLELRESLEFDSAGSHEVDIFINDKAENNRIATRKSIVNVYADTNILVVSHDSAPHFIDAVRSTGKGYYLTDPNTLSSKLNLLENASVIILNDIAIYDLSDSLWQKIVKKIRLQGAGLVVLGGDNSFGLGAYRKSILEDSLPVWSMPSDTGEGTAILFVLDKSGSMASKRKNSSKLNVAYNAIFETAKSVSPNDLAGLVAFDTQLKVLVPLGKYNNAPQAFSRKMKIRSSGGTNLTDALIESTSILGKAPVKKRIMVLVTDGSANIDRIDEIKQNILDQEADVIVLLIDSEEKSDSLRQISELNDGKLIHINDILRLPFFMRSQIEQKQQLKMVKTVVPKLLSPIPGYADQQAGTWPAIDEYLITRLKPTATQFLATPSGEPVISANQIGSGIVLAIPTDLSKWAMKWPNDTDWVQFIDALLTWVDKKSGHTQIYPKVSVEPGFLHYDIDILDTQANWYQGGATPNVSVLDPMGTPMKVDVENIAAGKYILNVPAQQQGIFKTQISIGQRSLNYDTYYPLEEKASDQRIGEKNIARWLNHGIMQPWEDDFVDVLQSAYSHLLYTRPFILLFVVVFYLVVLMWELKQGRL
jgi:Mg-chelatase subunit ChlD